MDRKKCVIFLKTYVLEIGFCDRNPHESMYNWQSKLLIHFLYQVIRSRVLEPVPVVIGCEVGYTHPGQDINPSKGHTETGMTNNHPPSYSHF